LLKKKNVKKYYSRDEDHEFTRVIRLKGQNQCRRYYPYQKIWLPLSVIWIKNMAYSKSQKIIKVCIPCKLIELNKEN
jgi:hypothetical protein